jgi:hypothetical protein
VNNEPNGGEDTSARRTAFVLIPFAGEFDDVYHYGIIPALRRCGYNAERPDSLSLTSRVLTEIISHIAKADVVIADLSHTNPNVLYELGVAHSLGRPTILISSKSDDLPFDLRDFRVIIYQSIKRLNMQLETALASLAEGEFAPLSVLQALPQQDTVPRKQFLQMEQELDRVRQELRVKTEELALVKTAKPETLEVIDLRNELGRHIEQLGNQILSRATGEIVELKVEVERLRRESDALRSAEQELRYLKQMTLVKPRWGGGDFAPENNLCFLLMPFREAWSDAVWKLIDGIISDCHLRCERADEKDGRVVMDDIWTGIRKARYIIADLTSKNSNVTYEVGLADVVGKEVILLSQSATDVPFDFLGQRLITYENSIQGVQKLSTELRRRLGGHDPQS